MVEGVCSGAGDVTGGRGGKRDQIQEVALLWEPGMREGEILVTVRDRRDESR